MGQSESSQRRKNSNGTDRQDMLVEENRAVEIGVAVAAVVGVGLLAWGLGSLLPSSERKGKMMKAPGRDSFIFRQDFEDDPAKYFRALRKPPASSSKP